MKKRLKHLLCLVMAFTVFMESGVCAYADQISDLKKKNQQDQDKLDELGDQIDELAGEQQGIKGEMDSLQAEIADIMARSKKTFRRRRNRLHNRRKIWRLPGKMSRTSIMR